MDQQTIDGFRRALLDRGRSVLGRRWRVLAKVYGLSPDRESDWEKQSADKLFQILTPSDRVAITRISASLARIAQGSYGECVICYHPIDEQRLRAMPETDRCGCCANSN